MCEKTITSAHMKLKNSPAVNKPFRSLFNSPDVTSKRKSNVENLEQVNFKSQAKNTKRKLSQELIVMKKIARFDFENDMENVEIDKSMNIFPSDLEELEKRILKKQKEIEILKNEISYCKKNNSDDLETDIKQWRYACQEALERLQKDLENKRGQVMTMEEILSSLGIPKSLVHYSTENDTFIK
ncbi:swi5-dependent recombination DNA repair protein 1 [Vespula squamosa]|uniref:Swi5-dependent recombination DNA repair protein 1 homolog n=1 Tax=Vespula squamosa TaxID=30214 RepID=A0ABD2A6I7_VESSQ